MPSSRTLKYYIILSVLFHAVLAEVSVLIPVPAKPSDDVMVVDLADIPRSTDFLRPKPGIVKGIRPTPPPPRPVPPPRKIPARDVLKGRVPDLPVNPNLPPEKEFPIPRAKKPEDRNPVEPAKTASAPKTQEKVEGKAGTGGPPAPPPPPRKTEELRSLRDLTPSLGKMVLARTEPGAGRGQESSHGTAVGTGGKAEKSGVIVEEQGGGARLTSLNAPEIQYISYFAGIKRKIELVWQYPYDAQIAGIQGELVVEFTIGRDGRLASVDLVQGSGRKILDDEAISAIRKAAPYDPIPKEYKIPELKIRGHFIYEMHSMRIR
jgi:periplasmic protein TonB